MADVQQLRKKGVRGTLWNFTKIMVGQVQSFVVSIFLARLLMPEDFGTVGLALVFAYFVECFVDFGFATAIIQKQNINQAQLSTVFWLNCLIAIFLSLVMYASSGAIAAFFDVAILDMIVRVYSITFIIKALGGVPSAIFAQKLQFRTPVVISLVSSTVSGLTGILLAFWGYGVWSLVIAQVANWILSTILTWVYVGWRPSFVFQLREIRELWCYGYKYSLSVVIDNAFVRLDTLIIGKCFSPYLLGFYYRAQSLNRLVIQYAFSSIAHTLFPVLSKLGHEVEILRSNTHYLIQVTCFLTFLFAGGMYVSSTEAFVFLFGEKWLPSLPYFEILAIFSICYTLPPVLVTPLYSMGKSGLALKIEILKKILLLVSIPLGLCYGLDGYIWAVNLAAAFTMLFNMKALAVMNLDILSQIKPLILYGGTFALLLLGGHFFLPDIISGSIFWDGVMKALAYVVVYCGIHLAMKSAGLTLLVKMVRTFLPGGAR